jgi:hypothetical protein
MDEVALMPGSMNRRAIIGVWFGVLAAVAGAGALSGGSITLGTGALWLFACVAPPAVMLMVWRGADRCTHAVHGRPSELMCLERVEE